MQIISCMVAPPPYSPTLPRYRSSQSNTTFTSCPRCSVTS
jgi:hypothetical protein